MMRRTTTSLLRMNLKKRLIETQTPFTVGSAKRKKEGANSSFQIAVRLGLPTRTAAAAGRRMVPVWHLFDLQRLLQHIW